MKLSNQISHADALEAVEILFSIAEQTQGAHEVHLGLDCVKEIHAWAKKVEEPTE